MSDPPPDPPHQPDQNDRPDHPMPPALPGVSPDSPVDPPLPPRDNRAAEVPQSNGKSSQFPPQVHSIDWGVMFLCRLSRHHHNRFFRLSWCHHHLQFSRTPKHKTMMKSLNCPTLRKKKKQLHLLCRAVHPRSRRQERRRSQGEPRRRRFAWFISQERTCSFIQLQSEQSSQLADAI